MSQPDWHLHTLMQEHRRQEIADEKHNWILNGCWAEPFPTGISPFTRVQRSQTLYESMMDFIADRIADGDPLALAWAGARYDAMLEDQS